MNFIYFQLHPFLSFDKLWDFELEEVFKVWRLWHCNKKCAITGIHRLRKVKIAFQHLVVCAQRLSLQPHTAHKYLWLKIH